MEAPSAVGISRAFGAVALLLVGAAGAVLAGCTPSIGDQCTLSTDCSINGDRLCDNAQPGGYCTQFNCAGNKCPDKAACVLFNGALPGCAFDDRSGSYGSRVGRSACMARCTSNSDCRSGYVCADPRTAPWSGIILDDDQTQLTCMVAPVGYLDASVIDGAAPVCSAVGPDLPPIDASAAPLVDGAAPLPGPVDAGADAADAGDAGDASDGG